MTIAAQPSTAATHSTSSVISMPKTQVIIQVINVNDNAPNFIIPDPHGNTSIEVSSLVGLGHVILEPEVKDRDCTGNEAHKFSFSISNANGASVDGFLRVNMETGSVTIDGDLEPLAETEVVLFLTVADLGDPVLKSSVYFQVVIRKDEPPVSFFARLISGDSVTTAVAIAIGLASVILVLVLVIVALCLARPDRRRRSRKASTQQSRNQPPDIVCCQIDEGATPSDLLLSGQPVKLQLQVSNVATLHTYIHAYIQTCTLYTCIHY